MAGPFVPAKIDTGEVISFRNVGGDGVDLLTRVAALEPTVLSRAENMDFTRGTADRRTGALKLAQVVDPTTAGKSRTYAATTKYATFTPPLIPLGGFAFVRHFVATRPSAGNTAWILASRPAAQTYHVLSITLSDAGVITVTWTDTGGTARTVACTAVDDGLTVHLFAIYDAVAGTFTVYINGASSGTPLTGLASTLQPKQDTGVVWVFGVMKQTGQAVTANTNFDGASDGFTLFSLRGTRPASGTTTLAETLRRHSARAWPTPQMKGFVLAHYDEDEPSGTVMYDRSEEKNHGTYVGTPTVSDPVALLSAPCNYIGRIDGPSGEWNLVGQFGRLFTERLGAAVV